MTFTHWIRKTIESLVKKQKKHILSAIKSASELPVPTWNEERWISNSQSAVSCRLSHYMLEVLFTQKERKYNTSLVGFLLSGRTLPNGGKEELARDPGLGLSCTLNYETPFSHIFILKYKWMPLGIHLYEYFYQTVQLHTNKSYFSHQTIHWVSVQLTVD